jgi:hypothetical protein
MTKDSFPGSHSQAERAAAHSLALVAKLVDAIVWIADISPTKVSNPLTVLASTECLARPDSSCLG